MTKKDAPKYFQQDMKRSKKFDNEIADILNVGKSWIRQRRKRGKGIEEHLKQMEISEKDFRKLNFYLSLQSNYQSYAWSKFKYRNRKNEFGKPGSILRYNQEEKTIEIVQDGDKIYDNLEKQVRRTLKPTLIERLLRKVERFINSLTV